MGIQEIADIINGRILTAASGPGRDIRHAFSSDLMSDVLTRDYEDTVLITGLANLQAIRTAEMSDIGLIIIARNKEVGDDMIQLAEASDIVLIKSAYSLFRISGLLYEAGIKPIF
jgi:predicted transcriptional regulator